jgi:hypothetical protein
VRRERPTGHDSGGQATPTRYVLDAMSGALLGKAAQATASVNAGPGRAPRSTGNRGIGQACTVLRLFDWLVACSAAVDTGIWGAK